MTIDEAWTFCQTMAKKEGAQGRFSPLEFNAWISFAQAIAVTERFRVIHTDADARELLEPLLEQFPVPEPNGYIPIPAGILGIESIYTEAGHEVDILPPAQFQKRRISTLKGPSEEYPIAEQLGQSYRLLPVSVPVVNVYAYRKPKRPLWAFTEDEGAFQYSPADSQGLESHERLHEEICIRTLVYAGVNLSNDLLVQYGLEHLKKTPRP